MHPNSLTAYRESVATLSQRKRLIYHHLLGVGPRTAREILGALYPDSGDPNLVRPRLTELKDDGLITEWRTTVENGHQVTIFKALQPPGEQEGMF
ncbi:MAG TPA: hypothetical protein ENI07_16060 [Desulfobacterales bacterium]|nr:hypothetical protein [Desulfobacterales bacterium]